MTHRAPPQHFKGKSVADHLKQARLKGARATTEPHGTELAGHIAAGADSAKDGAISYLILWTILFSLSLSFQMNLAILLTFGIAWLFWKTGRSALLGWARLERLHRVIEEERWEIEHHREQEKEELYELYAAKGFSGKLLDQVISVLSANENRLLQIMLEEELGLTLEAYEHPLKQAFGAAIGSIVTFLASLTAYFFWPSWGLPITATLCLLTAATITAQSEKRNLLFTLIWNSSLAFFITLTAFLLVRWII